MARTANPSKEEEKQRRDEHFERQKALLTSGNYSDLTLTCGPRTWHVHKAIICPSSGFFARAVTFGKERCDNTIDLPQDDPDIISLLLDFLYTLDYDAHDESDSEDPHPESLWFSYSEKDELTATERRKLQEGLFKVNVDAMKAAVGVTKETFPEVLPSGRNFINIPTSQITRPYLSSILSILSAPSSHTGEKFYAQDYTDSAPTHAKLYCLADKYDVPSLRTLALARLTKDVSNRPLDDNVVVKALTILLENTPEEDGTARKMVVQCLDRDMRRFGIRRCNRVIFERWPELHEWYLRWLFGEEDKEDEVVEEEEKKDGEEAETVVEGGTAAEGAEV